MLDFSWGELAQKGAWHGQSEGELLLPALAVQPSSAGVSLCVPCWVPSRPYRHRNAHGQIPAGDGAWCWLQSCLEEAVISQKAARSLLATSPCSGGEHQTGARVRPNAARMHPVTQARTGCSCKSCLGARAGWKKRAVSSCRIKLLLRARAGLNWALSSCTLRLEPRQGLAARMGTCRLLTRVASQPAEMNRVLVQGLIWCLCAC